MKYFYKDTKIGPLTFVSEDDYLIGLYFGKKDIKGDFEKSEVIEKSIKEIEEYLNKKRKTFDIPLKFSGTEFQKKVWNVLLEIPYGKTKSYKDVAEKVGSPKGYRAVGMANNKNPISIIAPCHRVIGSNGKLVGYGGGLDIKRYLLELEKGIS